MDTLQQLEQTLIAANEAGDIESVNGLAKEITRLQSSQGAMANTPEDEPLEHDFNALNMIKNIPGDAAKVGGEIWKAVTHPVETTKSIGGMIEMGGDILTRGGRQNYEVDPRLAHLRGQEQEIQQAAMDKYGSIDKFQRTLENQPVSTGMDIGSVAAPAAMALPKAGAIANALRTGTNPVHAAKVATRLPSKAIPERMPEWMYEGAAKFGTKLEPGEKKILSRAALDNEIPITPSGYDKLSGKLNDLGSQIGTLVDEATAAGKSIPVDDVFRGIDDLAKEYGGPARLEGAKNVKKIQKIAGAYKEQLAVNGKTHFTPRELQDFKTNLYNDINFDAKNLRTKPMTEVTRRDFANSAKDSLEQHMPGIGDLNSQYGPLKQLKDNLMPAVSRTMNHDPLSLTTGTKAIAGELMAPGIGGIAGVTSGVISKPGAMSRMAIALDKARKKPAMRPGYIPPDMWLAMYQAEQLRSNAQDTN